MYSRFGLDAKLLASVINSSTGRCWSSDVYNPVPGVIENVPSSRDYQVNYNLIFMTKSIIHQLFNFIVYREVLRQDF